MNFSFKPYTKINFQFLREDCVYYNMPQYTRVFYNVGLFERVRIYLKLLIILVHKTCKDWNLVIAISYFELTKTWAITKGVYNLDGHDLPIDIILWPTCSCSNRPSLLGSKCLVLKQTMWKPHNHNDLTPSIFLFLNYG